MALITINGVALKDPSVYNALSSDIVDDGRNILGYLVADVIRHDVAKVEATWNYLTVAEWSTILKRFNPSYGGSFITTVTYFDQCTASMQTRRMYVSDRSAGLVNLDSAGNPRGWTECKLSLVEV